MNADVLKELEKMAGARWRSPVNLPTVAGSQRGPLSLRTDQLMDAKRRLGLNPVLPGLDAKLATLPATKLQNTHGFAAGPPEFAYRGHRRFDPTVTNPKYNGVVHATPHPSVAAEYGRVLYTPGATGSPQRLVSRFPVKPDALYTRDYGTATGSEPGKPFSAIAAGRTRKNILTPEVNAEGLPVQTAAYETNVAGVRPDTRFLMRPTGRGVVEARELAPGKPNDALLRQLLRMSGGK